MAPPRVTVLGSTLPEPGSTADGSSMVRFTAPLGVVLAAAFLSAPEFFEPASHLLGWVVSFVVDAPYVDGRFLTATSHVPIAIVMHPNCLCPEVLIGGLFLVSFGFRYRGWVCIVPLIWLGLNVFRVFLLLQWLPSVESYEPIHSVTYYGYLAVAAIAHLGFTVFGSRIPKPRDLGVRRPAGLEIAGRSEAELRVGCASRS